MYLLRGNTCPQVLDIVFKSESFERVSSNWDQPNIIIVYFINDHIQFW